MKHDEQESPAPLTTKQLGSLRERLVSERERLNAHTRMAIVREPTERAAEAMDEAQASLEQHEALGLAAHEHALLQHIERALKKIEAGTYGISEDSGEPIGIKRLQAVPWARFTAGEQEELEARSRQYRG
jgi:DnaK suppressor protein